MPFPFPRSQRGIDAIIATILLLLVSLAITALLYSWLAGFTTEKTEQASKQSEESFECGQASFRITSCDYDVNRGNRGSLEVKLESKGKLDLNDWTAFVEYTDGNVDRNLADDRNLYAGGRLTVYYGDLTPNKTVKTVKMVPGNCKEITQEVKACS